ncbi:hypothetical protein HAX54_006236 [Datura stramonium]|uniref:Uncharacterized protein n=1 Tax=Datura stramonium TaxID=4076 RepID=A0ABS8TBC9_DATST|nr:hypothetical protein [Datura stramonium]
MKLMIVALMLRRHRLLGDDSHCGSVTLVSSSFTYVDGVGDLKWDSNIISEARRLVFSENLGEKTREGPYFDCGGRCGFVVQSVIDVSVSSFDSQAEDRRFSGFYLLTGTAVPARRNMLVQHCVGRLGSDTGSPGVSGSLWCRIHRSSLGGFSSDRDRMHLSTSWRSRSNVIRAFPRSVSNSFYLVGW